MSYILQYLKWWSVALSALMCLHAVAPTELNAQEMQTLDSAYLSVTYAYNRKNTINSMPLDDDLILAIGHRASLCYSPNTFQSDSLRSLADLTLYRQRFDSALKKGVILYTKYHMYTYKETAPVRRVRMVNSINTQYYSYPDQLHDQEWALVDSARTIMDYECLMATCDNRGRKWTAWYAPDLPIDNGPWLLGGLPGLILEANEAEGIYHFRAKGLQQNTVPTPIIILTNPNGKGYVETNRRDFLKHHKAFHFNSMAMIEAETGIHMGTSSPEPKRYDPLEILEDE